MYLYTYVYLKPYIRRSQVKVASPLKAGILVVVTRKGKANIGALIYRCRTYGSTDCCYLNILRTMDQEYHLR